MAIVYPQVIPELSRPRSVERPESVKYYQIVSSMQSCDGLGTHTRGKKMIETISSSFSVIVMARLPCRGTMSPTMNAPVKVSIK
jgi:hypothetical protein